MTPGDDGGRDWSDPPKAKENQGLLVTLELHKKARKTFSCRAPLLSSIVCVCVFHREMQLSLHTDYISFAYICSSELAGLCISFIFIFFSKFPTVFHYN